MEALAVGQGHRPRHLRFRLVSGRPDHRRAPIKLDPISYQAGINDLLTGGSGTPADVVTVLRAIPSRHLPWNDTTELPMNSPTIQQWWEEATPHPQRVTRARGVPATVHRHPLADAQARETHDGHRLLANQETLRTFVPSRGSLDTSTEARLVPSPRGGGELLLHGILEGTPTWQLAARRDPLNWGYHGGSVAELAALLHTLRPGGPTADTSHLNYQQAHNEGLVARLATLPIDQEIVLPWPW